jgi:hypothetical protein
MNDHHNSEHKADDFDTGKQSKQGMSKKISLYPSYIMLGNH